jgi:pyridinium-3,5-bisthiocarboxylic acid mononucleotide nickel chelatase
MASLAYIDPIGGAAGDMLLAALIHSGAPLESIQAGLAKLALGVHIEVSPVERQALGARQVQVVVPEDPQPERHLSEVLSLIEGARLSPRVTEQASRAFRLLAEAEAAVHETSVDRIHFHEVGALDSIADTLGVLLALEALGIERVEAAPLPMAGGTIQAAHGTLPLPAPAVLGIAQRAKIPLQGREGRGELVTPTAAALLGVVVERWGPLPGMVVSAVGYGAGTRVSPEGSPPNLTRVVLGDTCPEGTPGEVVVIEANLDDQTPERTAYLCEALREAGALEVYTTAACFKKGRAGWVLTVITDPVRAGLIEERVLSESSTLGVRTRHETRRVLPRELREVETPFGTVRVKQARRPDGRLSRAPEYEDCARLAREQGVPLWEVFKAAEEA